MPKLEFKEISAYFYSSYANPDAINAQFYFHRYIWELLEAKGLTTYSEFKLKGHVLLYKYAIEYVYEEFLCMLNQSAICNYFEMVTYENFKHLCPADQNPIENYLQGIKNGLSTMAKNLLVPLVPIFLSTAEMRNATKDNILDSINLATGGFISNADVINMSHIIFRNLVLLYKETIYTVLDQSAYTIFCALRLTLNKSEDFFDLREMCIDENGMQRLMHKAYTYEVYKSKIQVTESQDNKSKAIELYINSLPK
ncbi:hypothetical protein [Candidatus Epulonipiscium viviparus]|uniref:hypothetical protein n=1 Tax=Candidatus Epulonipiscium viviparus TaxID=420336 RepID=UPI00016BFCA2|nr:hypothetical protein [Candidatus Epulopiscium viviparus]